MHGNRVVTLSTGGKVYESREFARVFHFSAAPTATAGFMGFVFDIS
jgi:hypothetical protein